MSAISPVLVALKRREGWEDTHPELVMEDALRPGFMYSVVREEGDSVVVAIERTDGYERVAATSFAKEVVKPTWLAWSVVKH